MDTLAPVFVPCANSTMAQDCENLADTRTGGDMNPIGPVAYYCDECIDSMAADYYG
jgi:hypothetical protein